METPLTPLEFARRARRLYADREAVVDGYLRLTYASSSTAATAGRPRCSDSASRQGDRVAYIAPNTHAQLESFYAVPQIGAVARADQLSAHRRRLRVHHQPQRRRVVCVHADYLDAVDSIRAADAERRAFRRARRSAAAGWLDYETAARGASPEFERPRSTKTISCRSTTPAARPRGRRA